MRALDPLANLLKGHVNGVKWANVVSDKGTIENRLEVALNDPFATIKSVSVGLFPAPAKPDAEKESAQDTFSPGHVIKNGQKTALTIKKGTQATGSVQLPANYILGTDLVPELELTFASGAVEYVRLNKISIPLKQSVEELTGNTASPRETRMIPLKTRSLDFAFNRENGDMAVVSESDRLLRLHPASYFQQGGGKAELASHEFVRRPLSVVYKRYLGVALYAVVCRYDHHIYFFDAGTLAPMGAVEVDLSKTSGRGHSGRQSDKLTNLWASRSPVDPKLYFAHGSRSETHIGVIDLSNFSTQASILGRTATDMGVSSTGRFVYRRNGYVSPTGFVSLEWKKQDGVEKLETVLSEHRSTGAYMPDVYEQYVASGKTIYSRDLRRKMGTVPFEVKCFLEGKPLLAGADRSNILLASLNSLENRCKHSAAGKIREGIQ